jgi:hypothetical protein
MECATHLPESRSTQEFVLLSGLEYSAETA